MLFVCLLNFIISFCLLKFLVVLRFLFFVFSLYDSRLLCIWIFYVLLFSIWPSKLLKLLLRWMTNQTRARGIAKMSRSSRWSIGLVGCRDNFSTFDPIDVSVCKCRVIIIFNAIIICLLWAVWFAYALYCSVETVFVRFHRDLKMPFFLVFVLVAVTSEAPLSVLRLLVSFRLVEPATNKRFLQDVFPFELAILRYCSIFIY